MHSMGKVLWDLFGEEIVGNNEHGLPPGFRFHPTDEELITFYLASKVFNGACCGVDIVEVDLNRCEPWELPDVARMGEREWYFFSLRDRKYPTGLRTNRATGAGYWKATGKDREVHNSVTGALVGMKKTLVFYKGRAPRGEKTKWVLHEYRLEGDFACSRRRACKEEWVICRIFHKLAGGDHNKMMTKSPYYSSPNPPNFQYPSPPPFPNPSSSSSGSPLPFLHDLQTPIQTLIQPNYNVNNNNNNGGLISYMQQEANNTTMLIPFPPLPNSFNSIFTAKGDPLAQLGGVNSSQLEPSPSTTSSWLEAYLQQNPFLYEMGPSDMPFHLGPIPKAASGPLVS